MEYYGNNDWRDYCSLEHHGILGMKWGKRNGPPYPLGSGDHSVSEKKAGWRKSLGGGSGGNAKSKARKFVQSGAGGINRAATKIKSNNDEKSSTAKSRRKERDRKIQEKYDRAIEKIEQPYKRGQTLSDEDYKKQQKWDKKSEKEWKESKDQYKRERAEEKAAKKEKRAETRKNIKESVKKAAKGAVDSYVKSVKYEEERKQAESDRAMEKVDAYWKNIEKQKTVGKKIKAGLLGSDDLQRKYYEIDAKSYDKLSKSKNKNWYSEAYNKQQAANARAQADYFKKRSKMSKGRKVFETLTLTDYKNTPYYDLSGRKTTIGQEAVKRAARQAMWDELERNLRKYR